MGKGWECGKPFRATDGHRWTRITAFVFDLYASVCIRGLPFRFVLGDANLPGGAEGSGKDVFVGGGEADMGGAVASPASGDGEEEVGRLFDEVGLLLGVSMRLP